jgi:hypothetical protein
LTPILVVFGSVAVDGLVAAAMNSEIGLLVAVEIEPPDHYGPIHRILENRSLDGNASPEDFTRSTDIDRDDVHVVLLRGKKARDTTGHLALE